MLACPRHVLAVQDLARSTAYYRDVLGFEIRWQDVPGWRLFVRGECLIMAGECLDAPPALDLGDHSYFAYVEVKGINAFHDELAARGADLFKPLRDEIWGMREFGIRTVDGHRMMFGEPRKSCIAPTAPA